MTLAWIAGIEVPSGSLGSPMLDIFVDPPMATLTERLNGQRQLSWAEEQTRLESAGRGRRAAFAAALGLMLFLGAAWLHQSNRLALCWSDGLPAMAYCALFAVTYAALGYRISWSVPRGHALFLVDTAIAGLAGTIGALAVARICDPHRARVSQQAMPVVLFWALYLVAAGWVGSPSRMAGPVVTFAFVLIATAEFYFAAAFGARVVNAALSPLSTRGAFR